MKKNKNVILIVLGCLIILSFGLLIGFYKSRIVVMDINSDLIKELYYSINPSSDASIASMLYQENALPNEYIIDIGLMAYIKEVGKENASIIPREKVEEKINTILGSIAYFHSKVYLLEEVCGYTYNDELKQYEVIEGCGGNWYERLHKKMVSARKKRNQIIITEKLIYETDDWNDTISKRTIYSDLNKTKKLDYKEVSSNINYSIEIDDYLEDASTFEMIFEQKGDRYIFKNIVKIN